MTVWLEFTNTDTEGNKSRIFLDAYCIDGMYESHTNKKKVCVTASCQQYWVDGNLDEIYEFVVGSTIAIDESVPKPRKCGCNPPFTSKQDG